MAIIKQAKNMTIRVKGTSTVVCGQYIKIAESISITATKGNLQLISNKKIIVEGENGGVILGKYTPPKEPKVLKMYWMDESESMLLESIENGQTAIFIAATSDYEIGDMVTFSMENKDTKEVITLSGNVDAEDMVKIKWTNK